MLLYPAIDVIDGKAVRLTKGDYSRVTVYSQDVAAQARAFMDAGAEYLHMVDLEGARDGGTPNYEYIRKAISDTGLKVEVGGGIRSEDAIRKYLDAGALRVILGTAALGEPSFLMNMLDKFGEKIAVGVDIKNGVVATHGWTQVTGETCRDALLRLEGLGVKTIICTDISKDGMLSGANMALYSDISHTCGMDIIASGGVSSLSDINLLREMGLYGAIVGKAYYEGRVRIQDALAASGGRV